MPAIQLEFGCCVEAIGECIVLCDWANKLTQRRLLGLLKAGRFPKVHRRTKSLGIDMSR